MSARIAKLLGRAMTRSSLSEPITLDTAAHGIVRSRGHVVRREFEKERDDGAWIVDATHFIVIERAVAPQLARGDKITDSDGQPWDILVPLDDGGGCWKCQLRKIQLPRPPNTNGPSSSIDAIELEDSAGEDLAVVYGKVV